MAYTAVWDETVPLGSAAANTIDDLIRALKRDQREREADYLALPSASAASYATDPLRPYGLKFTDAQDAVISLGDNGGTARNLSIKNKAGSTIYFTFGQTSLDIVGALNLTINTNKFTVAGATGNVVIAGDVSIAATKKLYVDGGGNTYIQEVSADNLVLVAGGTTVSTFTAAGQSIPALLKLYLDGGGDTFIREVSADVMEFDTGGSARLQIGSNVVVTANAHLVIQPTLRFYLDGGGDTYIVESAGNTLDLVVGGSTLLRLITSQLLLANTVDIVLSTTKKVILNGTDTYINENAGVVSVTVAGNQILSVQAGAVDAVVTARMSAKYFLANGVVGSTGAGQIAYGATTQTTVGGAGGASALPATPRGYIIIDVAGTNRVIPYYDKV